MLWLCSAVDALNSVCVAAMASARALSWLSQIAAVQCSLCSAVVQSGAAGRAQPQHESPKPAAHHGAPVSVAHDAHSSAQACFASALQAASASRTGLGHLILQTPRNERAGRRRFREPGRMHANSQLCRPKSAEHAANRSSFERQTAPRDEHQIAAPRQRRTARNTRPRRSKKRLEA